MHVADRRAATSAGGRLGAVRAPERGRPSEDCALLTGNCAGRRILNPGDGYANRATKVCRPVLRLLRYLRLEHHPLRRGSPNPSGEEKRDTWKVISLDGGGSRCAPPVCELLGHLRCRHFGYPDGSTVGGNDRYVAPGAVKGSRPRAGRGARGSGQRDLLKAPEVSVLRPGPRNLTGRFPHGYLV